MARSTTFVTVDPSLKVALIVTDALWQVGSAVAGIASRSLMISGSLTTAQQCAGSGMEYAELAFQPSLWIALACQFQHERMRCQVHADDIVGAISQFIAQLDAAVDRGVDHDTAGEWLVGI